MKILIAPDSFKGSLTAMEACEAIEQGVRIVFPEAIAQKLPVADGGEGTIEAIYSATGCELVHENVTGPMGQRVQAKYAVLDDKTAFIEMASASGLLLTEKNTRNPMAATTYGTGELIRAALDRGCRNIYIGLGGSATNDGGAGMAQALGYGFFDADGNELGFGGGVLDKLSRIDVSGADKRIKRSTFTAACDVKNSFFGPDGASVVYGPQKGATPDMVEKLDKNLAHLAKRIDESIGMDIGKTQGAGAAGGLGGGLMAFCGGELRSGIDMILDLMRFDRYMAHADLIITGEGRIDRQTAFGKVPYGVAKRAKRLGKPVIAFAGSVGEGADELFQLGIDAMVGIVNRPMSLDEAIKDAFDLLKETTAQSMRLLKTGGRLVE